MSGHIWRGVDLVGWRETEGTVPPFSHPCAIWHARVANARPEYTCLHKLDAHPLPYHTQPFARNLSVMSQPDGNGNMVVHSAATEHQPHDFAPLLRHFSSAALMGVELGLELNK